MRASTAVFLGLLCAGCATTHVHRMDDTVRPAREPATVAVLSEAPQRPYTVIAVIESKSGSVFDSFADLRREMVAQAASLGGEAVILGPDTTEESFILTGTAMVRSEDRRIRCEVIVYGGASGI